MATRYQELQNSHPCFGGKKTIKEEFICRLVPAAISNVSFVIERSG